MNTHSDYVSSNELSADFHEVVPNPPPVMEKITNEYGFPQYVDLHGNTICPSCHGLVMPNRGAGAVCDTCAHEAEMHMAHDWEDGELREQEAKEECHVCGSKQHGVNGICRGSFTDAPSKLDSITDENMQNFVDQENEKEAMRRFFAGEEPSWSHSCLHESCPVTAGYGKLDDYGHWEYPLPEPIDQWSKKKDFDLKVKLNGMKYKARILPFDSEEIIKRNFVHFCHDIGFGFGKSDLESLKASYDRQVEKLKETRNASDFLVTAAIGDSVNEHNSRIYLEIVDETYQAQGSISINL